MLASCLFDRNVWIIFAGRKAAKTLPVEVPSSDIMLPTRILT